LSRAYDDASASLLAPFTYSGLLWAMALGFLVFGNFPDGWALGGMSVIVASGLFIVSRQRLTVHRG
jgi:drug/metabolite transporter (DMT)-like permease